MQHSKMCFRRGGMMRRSVWGALVVLCLSLNLYTSTASAQAVYGAITGTVTDAQGNAVSGAKVTVTSLTKNTSVETTTNESGNYSVLHLIPDTYKVAIEAAGFKVTSIPSVIVEVDAASTVDAQLQ